jgi:formylglycine-generating enzyme required for sulfatase activity
MGFSRGQNMRCQSIELRATLCSTVLLLPIVLSFAFASPVYAQCSADDEVCFTEGAAQESAPTETGLTPAQQQALDTQISTRTYSAEQDRLVERITENLFNRQLASPAGNNALENIEKLKALQPYHDYSVNGTKYVARIYVLLGTAALEAGDTNKAESYLNSALELRNDLSEAAPLELALAVPEMTDIPAGSFTMGSTTGAGDERPVREVEVPAFRMSIHEITLAEYNRFLRATGNEPFGASDPSRPVAGIGWTDAVAYTAWLTELTGTTYRLPTEAEWEYAARAGTESEFNTGDTLEKLANCIGCNTEWENKSAAPVGSFPANAFGLHDMHGNVWEWVQDCWSDDYSGHDNTARAIESAECDSRILRGGSWYNEQSFARSSYRAHEPPEYTASGVGFRVVAE